MTVAFGRPCKGRVSLAGGIVVRETEAVLENCHALINKIIAELSAEDSSAAELLLHLEFAASALKRNVRTTSGRALN
jgi:hypothetical protein